MSRRRQTAARREREAARRVVLPARSHRRRLPTKTTHRLTTDSHPLPYVESETRQTICPFANRPLLVVDFRALWRSALSARVPESQK